MPRRDDRADEALPGLEDVEPFVRPAPPAQQEEAAGMPAPLGHLPAVRLRPAAELAPVARAAPLLRGIERLARWAVARRVRPTKRGRLRVGDARAAAAELDLPLGAVAGYPRPEPAEITVEQLWEVAVAAGLVAVDGTGAVQHGDDLGVLADAEDGTADPDPDPAEVLRIWSRVLDLVAASSGVALPVLLLLYVAPDPVSDDELVGAVLDSPFLGPVSSVLGGALAGIAGSMARAALVDLESLAVVDNRGGGVRLTELGLLGARGVLNGLGFDAPAIEDLAEADALTAFEVAGRSGEDRRDEVVSEWIAARGHRAAGDLVAMAAAGGAAERSAAFLALSSMDGAEVEAAVRSALERDELRAYAVSWLTERGLPGPEMTQQPALWLLMDALAAALETSDPDEAGPVIVPALAALGTAKEQAAVVARLADSGHPATGEVVELIRLHHPDRPVARAAGKAAVRLRGKEGSSPPASRRVPDSAYQLKIALRDLRPPVWRRVVVPGSISLRGLHDVVQVAMGWTDSHLHEFEIDGVRYGEPDPDFATFGPPVRPEGKVRLSDVAREGTRIRYVYDFGDDWRHDVVVEAVRPVEPGERLPVCTAGRRGCPPEDVGGPWGYANFLDAYGDPSHPEHADYRDWAGPFVDPARFDTAETTRRLRGIR